MEPPRPDPSFSSQPLTSHHFPSNQARFPNFSCWFFLLPSAKSFTGKTYNPCLCKWKKHLKILAWRTWIFIKENPAPSEGAIGLIPASLSCSLPFYGSTLQGNVWSSSHPAALQPLLETHPDAKCALWHQWDRGRRWDLTATYRERRGERRKGSRSTTDRLCLLRWKQFGRPWCSISLFLSPLAQNEEDRHFILPWLSASGGHTVRLDTDEFGQRPPNLIQAFSKAISIRWHQQMYFSF